MLYKGRKKKFQQSSYPSCISLQSRRNFGGRVLVIISVKIIWLPSLIYTVAKGWGEKKIRTKGVGDGQKEYSASFSPLTHPNKMPTP